MSGKIFKSSFFISVIFSILILSSCTKPKTKKSERVYLDKWTYSIDGRTFQEHKDSSLANLENYLPERKGLITLCTEFVIPWQMLSGDVGLALGNVKVAAKIYLNGKEISQTGIFPPEAFDGGRAYSNIRLSPQMLNLDKNTLEIVLWTDGVGSISGRPFISTYEDTGYYVNTMTFQNSKLNMIFSWSMVLSAIVYLLFYMQQKKQRQYRDYAFMSLWTAVYLIPHWVSEMPNLIGSVSYLLWIKGFSGAAAIVACYYATSFIRSFLKIETSKKIRIWRLSLMWIGVVVMMLIPSLVLFYRFIWVLVVFLVLELCFGISAIVKGFHDRASSVKRLIIGFSPVIVTVIIDFFVKIVFKNHLAPYLTLYGWQLTAIIFIAIVTNRYAKIRIQFEYLNENLEKEVIERTQELTMANEELERRQFEAARDMDLAVHVQKSFYSSIPNFKGWDIAVTFKPLSGVSGDLYDFYVLDGKLQGFGIFDVSGHGISSGLVTMLVKNTIFHSFRSTLRLPLDKAAKIINDQVIQVKGDIENYLTGCIFRLDENNASELEFVNAGAPYPIFKKAGNEYSEVIVPDESKPQYGMIGVRDMEVEFQTIKKSMQLGDVLVIYTDGITETENPDGMAFGKEGIQRYLNSIDTDKMSAQSIADSLLLEVKTFAGIDNILGDDITILVLKRTGDDSIPAEEELLELETV